MGMGQGGPGTQVLGTEDRARAVAAVRQMLRSASAAEDAAIGGFADSALALAETFTGLALIARAMTETVESGAGWQRLAGSPVRAITGVQTVAADGSTAPLAVGAYAIDIDALGEGWVRAAHAGRLRVTYQAGLADDWDALPPGLAQGATLLAVHLFEAREGALPPAAVAALWRPWRRMRLRPERRCA
ncbi:hypothetical protein ACG3SL_16990 [Sphingomonas sp. CJ20]